MNFWMVSLSGLIGYLFGSLSSARIISWLFVPKTDLSSIRQPIPNTDIVFVSDSVSASMMRVNAGTRYGCLTAVLDILKVFIPTLAIKLWQPDELYFVIVAAMGLVGHDWPIYHRFKGGRGESAILGGMLVIDPIGILITNLIGSSIGWLAGDVLVLRWSFLILLIPWLWFRSDQPVYVFYAIFINIIYWVKMIPELSQFIRILKKGGLSTQEEVAGDMAMGRILGRFLDQYGAPSLARKMGKKIL